MHKKAVRMLHNVLPKNKQFIESRLLTFKDLIEYQTALVMQQKTEYCQKIYKYNMQMYFNFRG